MSRRWTEHEEVFAETFTCRVKVSRDDQLRTIWSSVPCGPEPFPFSEALQRLAWAMECYIVNLHPPLHPIGPVLKVPKGRPYPDDLRPHSSFLRSRWHKAAIPTRVFVASRAAANLFGSTSAGLPPLEHRDHDVLLTDAFVRHLIEQPTTIHEWVGEQMLPKAGHRIKDPDAFKFRDGQAYQVVESGGAYSARQLTGLCRYAAERNLDLEVW